MSNMHGWVVASVLMAAGCAGGVGEDPASGASAETLAGAGGAVYVDSNESAGNRVLVFDRDADGSLTSAGAVTTGGTGTNSSLGSQGALALDATNRWLYAVNAGSNDISTFEVTRAGLRLASVTPSQGVLPVSLTVHDNLVYVLNAGGTPGIAGFVAYRGELTPIPGSVRPLGGTAADEPAEVHFNDDGSFLIVTEKVANRIDTFAVTARGAAGAVRVGTSNGQTPYGFAVTRRDLLVVSEAASDAVSSYTFNGRFTPVVVSGSVADHQGAPCWVALSSNDRFAWVTNAATATISTYGVGEDGRLTLLDGGATVLTGAGTGPTDEATDPSGRWLYVRESSGAAVAWFTVDPHGGLSGSLTVGGLTAYAAGIAAR